MTSPVRWFLPALGALLCTPTLAAEATETDTEATRLDNIHVTAQQARGYHTDYSQADTFGSFGYASLLDTPAAISVLTKEHLTDRQAHSLSEVARSDAALGDSYAPVGYYENLSVRGFALDLGTGYRLNELSMVGEQIQALEDKERVEIIKGLAGLEAGIVSPGGMINYVSKRPNEVRNATLGTDSHGSRYLAADVGHWLSPAVGLRVNAAHEDIHPQIRGADGRRDFLSLALDWKITPDTTLRFDGNHHNSAQRSASAYQLLGGRVIPEGIDRKTMLGYQPWQDPVRINANNASLRLDHRLHDNWSLQLAAGRSHSVIDDNVTYAYGCFYSPQCASGEVPGGYFAPNGDYDIYDYRSPDDTRVNDEVRGVLRGLFDTGPINHEISLGSSVFRRTIDRRAYVYDYVGTGNIFDPLPPVFTPSPNAPGNSVRRLTSWQRSVFALDRLHLGDHWQLLLGARHVSMDERAYKSSGKLKRQSRFNKTLPQTALMWQPNRQITTYISYSESLSLGEEAPYWTSNDGLFLPPRLARQTELGMKWTPSDQLNLGAALYHLRQPFQFAQPDDSSAGFTFVEQGKESRKGLELNAVGQLTDALKIVASLNLLQARATRTSTPDYEGHQLVNVPDQRAAVYLNYQFTQRPNLSLLAGWRQTGSNPATPDGMVQVSSYNVLDLGARYQTQWQDHDVTWRLSVDNVFNRFYWRDTGSSGGDQFLFPGLPRLARLTVSFGF